MTAATAFEVGQEVLFNHTPAIVRAVDPGEGWCSYQVSRRNRDGVWSEVRRWALDYELEPS